MDVSVIIPSYNSEKTIRECLNSLTNQHTDLQYEVIVADSGKDKTARLIKTHFPTVKLVTSRKRLYPGAARNMAIKRAKGKIIACTDADCVVNSDWLNSVYHSHEKYDVVGGRILNANPWNLFGWPLYFMEFGEFSRGRRRSVPFMPTCNISYKKRIFDIYGYFPPNLRTAEDRVFNCRIKEKFLFEPGIVIKHINKVNLFTIVRYAFLLGHGSAFSRKNSMSPGGFLFNHKFLIPLLFIHRFFLFGYRSAQARQFLMFLLTSPITIACLLSWNLGFLKGAFSSRQGGQV